MTKELLQQLLEALGSCKVFDGKSEWDYFDLDKVAAAITAGKQALAQQEQPAWIDIAHRTSIVSAVYEQLKKEFTGYIAPFDRLDADTVQRLVDSIKWMTQPAQEPVAWLIPSLASFKDAKSVHFSRVEGCTLTDAELIEKMSGEVIWRVEVFSDDDDGVIDKHGTHHAPKPLYTHPAPTQPAQEPVAWYLSEDSNILGVEWSRQKPKYGRDWTPLYKTAPTQPALSDAEILNCFSASKAEGMASYMLAVVRAIEAHCRGGADK